MILPIYSYVTNIYIISISHHQRTGEILNWKGCVDETLLYVFFLSFQVAERIIAPPHSEHRCRLSVICQCYCHVQNKFIIPGNIYLFKARPLRIYFSLFGSFCNLGTLHVKMYILYEFLI